jgi:hypothetical protein
VSRVLLCVSVFATAIAWGQGRPIAPVDCDDNFAECKEDCAIRWGGTTNMKLRAKLNPCLSKCGSAERDCRETFFETRRNNLDEGSISGSPSSRDVDSDGIPTKTSQKKEEPKRKEEDLRDDRRREEAAPVVEKKKEPEPKPSYELKPEETPKSNRTQISKVDDKGDKPRSEPKSEPKPEPKAAPVLEPKNSGLDSDVRSEDSAPPPQKKEEPRREEPKKKEEKKRALDEWDPDAL